MRYPNGVNSEIYLLKPRYTCSDRFQYLRLTLRLGRYSQSGVTQIFLAIVHLFPKSYLPMPLDANQTLRKCCLSCRADRSLTSTVPMDVPKLAVSTVMRPDSEGQP